MTGALIRAAVTADAVGIAAVYSPYVVEGYATFEEEPPSVEEVAARMANGLPWFVASRGGDIVGYAYAGPHHGRLGYRWSVNVSVYLAPSEVGQGTGRRLYAVLLGVLRDLGLVNAFAGVALPNDRSVRLHESFGFVPVGVYRHVGFKQGSWRDVGWWQLVLQDPPAEPVEPRAWD